MMPLSLRHALRWSGRLSLLLALLAPAALAQSDVLTPYDIARIETVGNVTVAPDGEHVAYTVSVPRDPFETNATSYSELYVYDVEAGANRGLRGGDVTHSRVAWTPDGRLSFLTRAADGDARPSLYVMDPMTGEMERTLRFATSIGAYTWSPDGSQVAFIAEEPMDEAEPALPYQPEIFEEETADSKLWIATPFSDTAPRMIDLAGTVYDLAWHPDGAQIAVAVAPTPFVDDSYMSQRIRILDATTGAVVTRIENPGKLGSFAWSPDGARLAFISAADLNDPASGRLMVADAQTGQFDDVLPGYEGHVNAIAWEDDDTIRYAADRGVESVMQRVRLSGGGGLLLSGGFATFSSFSISDDGDVIAFAADSPQHPSELYVMAGGAPGRVTDSNPWLAEKRLAPQEVIEYPARDGLMIQGMLIRPLDYEEGTRVPLVMIVHGGPESHYSNGWLTGYSLLGQMAAAKGYAVFYPNYRGSTGRGVAFSKTSQGEPAGAEFDDLVDGVDYLVGTGLVDGDKVGVTGGSYGGYATGWLSTRYSERFAAGVMFVGISNKVSKVGTTDIPNEEFYVHALKRPWDDWQFMLERSPIYYADQSVTPLLIMHGADDPRVHPTQSLELYRHLKLRGQAPVRLVYYPGEGHGNRKATARFDYTLRALRWFDHYLLGPGGDPPAADVSDLADEARPMMKDMMDGTGSN
jgi:dipeptidyl aminopeptidase/acylaminoacyl peptidase